MMAVVTVTVVSFWFQPPGQPRLPLLFGNKSCFYAVQASGSSSLSRFVIFWLKTPNLLIQWIVPNFKFLHDLEPKYMPPDSKALSTSYVPWLYKSKKQSIFSEWELDMVDLITATTDNASNIKAALQ